MEAVIGAIYLDRGITVSRKFIQTVIVSELKEIIKNRLYIDPKSDFQEKSQEKMGVTPTYKVLASSGPDHSKTFEVGVYLNDKLIASDTGSSKQEAQTKAAQKALKKQNWNI